MRSSNPVFNSEVFRTAGGRSAVGSNTMTVQGTVMKTALFLLIIIVAAGGAWMQALYNSSLIMPMAVGGLIGGLIFGFVTAFVPRLAPITGSLYAACEGVFLGAISMVFNVKYPGIALNAVLATFAVALAVLGVYSSGWVRVTEKFRTGVVVVTAGIALFYLASMILGFFGLNTLSKFIWNSGPIGIAFTLFVIVVVCANLILDFDFVEEGVVRRAPKEVEWLAAFGLTVTLVWLYIEMLRLLSKLNRR